MPSGSHPPSGETPYRLYIKNSLSERGGARRGLFDSCVRVRVAWRGDASWGRIGGRFRVVSCRVVSCRCLPLGGRRFSRYVSGDGDHTDAFSSPRSTKCPVELRCETSEHCENEGHSTKKHVLGDYYMGNFLLETSLCLKIIRSLYERNLEVGILHFLDRLQDGIAKSI